MRRTQCWRRSAGVHLLMRRGVAGQHHTSSSASLAKALFCPSTQHPEHASPPHCCSRDCPHLRLSIPLCSLNIHPHSSPPPRATLRTVCPATLLPPRTSAHHGSRPWTPAALAHQYVYTHLQSGAPDCTARMLTQLLLFPRRPLLRRLRPRGQCHRRRRDRRGCGPRQQ